MCATITHIAQNTIMPGGSPFVAYYIGESIDLFAFVSSSLVYLSNLYLFHSNKGKLMNVNPELGTGFTEIDIFVVVLLLTKTGSGFSQIEC